MLRNYLRLTWRNLIRQRGYSFINIFGLAVGMAAFLLITLFVRNELSFDAHHEDVSTVYRVILDADVMGQVVTTTSTPLPMAATLTAEVPEVSAAARIDPSSERLIRAGEKQFYQNGFAYADSSIFDILSLPLIDGDPASALSAPNTAVVSEDVARRLFGSTDVIDETFVVDQSKEYRITGVMTRAGPSHYQPEILASFRSSSRFDDSEWLNNTIQTYVRLHPGVQPEQLEPAFSRLVETYVAPRISQMIGIPRDQVFSNLKYEFLAEPVRDIYLHSVADHQIGPTGDVRYVYVLMAVAAFVLLIACVNFVNLATARSAGRAREVGLRKVLGSERSMLIRQFLGESFLVVVVSMILALAIVALSLPWFNNIAGTSLSMGPWMLVVVSLVTILAGLASGVYPAFVLSRFQPSTVLRGTFSTGKGGSLLRSGLVVFQFAISLALIASTAIVNRQLDYVREKDLGFDENQVVVLPLQNTETAEDFESVRDRLIQHTGILDVAASTGLPGPDHIHQTTVFRRGTAGEEGHMVSALVEVSHEYVPTLGIEVLHGRNFKRDMPTDREGFLISEAAAVELGWSPAESAVGEDLVQSGGNDDDTDRVGPVIGVFKDAHFNSLHQPVQPVILGMRTYWRYMPVRFQPEMAREVLDFLEVEMTALQPDYPFRYFFLDEDYAQYFDQERRLGTILSIFTGLAVLISCLGLFGLASFVTVQRRKEIGVRKVLGASVSGVVVLLSREFTRLVIVSALVGFPVAYLAMSRWLDGFAYSATIGWKIFLLSGLAGLLIAWLTVGYQSIRAAIADPVKSLRYE